MRSAFAAVVVVVLSLTPYAAAQVVPSGFVVETVFGAAQGLASPTDVAQLPDERFLVTQKAGALGVGVGSSFANIATIPDVLANSERGLLSVAVDPLFPAWPYIYLSYSWAFGMTRLVRYTVTGDLNDPNSLNLAITAPYLILEIPDTHPLHQAGCLRFGADGFLYYSSGDDNNVCAVQDLESLLGCIMRLDISAIRTATGSGPPSPSMIAAAGNPYTGPNSQLVIATGFRNPWRFAIDDTSGDILIGDVGNNDYEEINRMNLSALGPNMGWPFMEGPMATGISCSQSAATFEPPAYTWPHTMNPAYPHAAAVMGVYRNVPGRRYNFGPDYEGDVFFTDINLGFFRRFDVNAGSISLAAPALGQIDPSYWATGLPVVSGRIGIDGAMYLVNFFQNSLLRLRPVTCIGFNGLVIESGDNQTGTPDVPLSQPLTIRVCDGTNPIAGVPVTFSVTAGSGNFTPPTVVSDSNGRAVTLFTPTADSHLDPVLTASAAGFTPVSFNINWRGLRVDFDPLTAQLDMWVEGPGPGAPLLIAADFRPPMPVNYSKWGPLWVDILTPSPTAIALDGFGLFGAPLPFVATDANGSFSLSIPGVLPFGGISMAFQAFGFDVTQVPNYEAVLVSNPVFILIP